MAWLELAKGSTLERREAHGNLRTLGIYKGFLSGIQFMNMRRLPNAGKRTVSRNEKEQCQVLT